MSETRSSPTERLREWNDDGQLYLVGGVLTVSLAWFVFPILGLVSVWLGYQLYVEHERAFSSAFIVVLGGLAVVLWIGIIAGLV